MAGLRIGWQYLTGCCVATNPASRDRAEWPPHPGRVFMALAAAWFETGEDDAEGQALRWLENLGDPEMTVPDFVSPRRVVDVYVPVNDVAGPSKAILQSAPGLTRERKERTFPSLWIGDAPCFLHWPNADTAGVELHQSALDQLCGKVTRIGHSSSLVRMWVAGESELTGESWVPEDGLATFHARRISEGTLNLLDRQFNRRGREQHQMLEERISELKAEKPKGKGARERKTEINLELESLQKELERIDARDPIRPALGIWTGYRRREADSAPAVAHTSFDNDLLVLTQVDGPRLPLASTLIVTRALRNAMMAHIGMNIPDWVSGHQANGEPLRGPDQHLAFAPLAFVGSDYADGHLLGVALVFPRSITRPERGRAVGRFVVESSGEPRNISLHLGTIGTISLCKRDWNEPRQALVPETWTAHPRGAEMWASVTPVVLDRFPKSDPLREREAWEEEVKSIITTGCQRIGLPAPVEVAVGTTSWHRGSPRALAKRRSLRGHPDLVGADAPLGDGFPIYPPKSENGARPQVHVCLRFETPVVGPILLCAGRFLGYGLCKPIWGGTSR